MCGLLVNYNPVNILLSEADSEIKFEVMLVVFFLAKPLELSPPFLDCAVGMPCVGIPLKTWDWVVQGLKTLLLVALFIRTS